VTKYVCSVLHLRTEPVAQLLGCPLEVFAVAEPRQAIIHMLPGDPDASAVVNQHLQNRDLSNGHWKNPMSISTSEDFSRSTSGLPVSNHISRL
jgi:hypothetical protein